MIITITRKVRSLESYGKRSWTPAMAVPSSYGRLVPKDEDEDDVGDGGDE